MKFKEQWKQTDERCPHCNSVTKKAKGLNKQNLRRLVWSKPTALDWMMLVIWVSALLIAYRYSIEISQCQGVITNIHSICAQLYEEAGNSTEELRDLNISFNALNLTILEEDGV